MLDATKRQACVAARTRSIERAARSISEQPERGRRISDLAEIASLSPFHFARTFRTHTGVSPARFQTYARIALAKKLLVTSQESITEISFAVGYQSTGSFSAKFSRLVGISPLAWRRKAGECTKVPLEALKQSSARSDHGQTDDAVFGFVSGPDFDGVIAVGAFRTPAAVGKAVRISVVEPSGRYRLAGIPVGTKLWLVAVGFRWPRHADELLIQPAEMIGLAGPFVFGFTGSPDIAIRPKHWTDPPVLSPLSLALFDVDSRDGIRGRRLA